MKHSSFTLGAWLDYGDAQSRLRNRNVMRRAWKGGGEWVMKLNVPCASEGSAQKAKVLLETSENYFSRRHSSENSIRPDEIRAGADGDLLVRVGMNCWRLR